MIEVAGSREAKGILAHHNGGSTDGAFHVLRRYARVNGMRLTELCRPVVDGSLDLATLTGPTA